MKRSQLLARRRSIHMAAVAALAGSGLLFASRAARANTADNVISGQTDLSLAGTYNAGLPGTSSDVTFTNTAYSPNSFTFSGTGLQIGTLNDLSTTAITISTGALTLAGGSNSVSGTAADLLYVASGGNLNVTNTPISISTALGAGNFDIAGTATLGGVISGAGGFTKSGNGTLLLTGANTYSGNTSLSAGTLQLGSSSVGTAGTVGGNGLLTSSALGTGYLYIGGGGFVGFDLNGQTLGNRFTINSNNNTIKNTSVSAAYVTGALDGSLSGNNVSSFSVGNDNGGDINWTGVISRTNGSLGLTKLGNDTVTFSGATNTGVGLVALTAGVLNIGKTGANGAFADSVTVSGGATLRFRPDLGIASGGGTWGGQINGSLSIASGYIDLYGSSGQNSRVQQVYGTGGTITNSLAATSGVLGIAARSSAEYTLAAVIQDGSGTVGIEFAKDNMSNNNALGRINEFTAANTYSGATTITYGTYELGNALASQNSTITVNTASGLGTNSTYSLTTTSPLAFANGIGTFTIGGLAGAGNFALTDIGRTAAGATATAATVNLQIGSNLTINASPAAYTGVISDGTVAGGTVVKIGSSTEIFSGNNTYTGATSISAGTLQLGSGGTTGALSGTSTVADNGTFIINRSNGVAQGTDFGSGAIIGSGGVIQSGGGSTTLNAANTYSAGTTISGGTLVLGSSSAYVGTTLTSGALGTGFVANNQHTLDLNGQTLSNLLIQNTNLGNVNGTFTNSSANTAYVTTGFNPAGTGSYVISDFVVSGTGDINWSGAIDRTLFIGTLTKNGNNTLILSGVGSGYAGFNYTVSAGALALSMTSGSTFNSGTIGLSSVAAVIGNEGSGVTNTINQSINGAGTFAQTGAGKTILSQANSYSGGTSVSNGTLQTTVANALGTGNVYVMAGGALVTGNVSTIADAATLSIDNGATDSLNYTGSDFVGSLVLGGVTQTLAGTYGSSTSGATYQSSFFSGTGTVTVPEPASLSALMLAGTGLLARRRRRRTA